MSDSSALDRRAMWALAAKASFKCDGITAQCTLRDKSEHKFARTRCFDPVTDRLVPPYATGLQKIRASNDSAERVREVM